MPAQHSRRERDAREHGPTPGRAAVFGVQRARPAPEPTRHGLGLDPRAGSNGPAAGNAARHGDAHHRVREPAGFEHLVHAFPEQARRGWHGEAQHGCGEHEPLHVELPCERPAGVDAQRLEQPSAVSRAAVEHAQRSLLAAHDPTVEPDGAIRDARARGERQGHGGGA